MPKRTANSTLQRTGRNHVRSFVRSGNTERPLAQQAVIRNGAVKGVLRRNEFGRVISALVQCRAVCNCNMCPCWNFHAAGNYDEMNCGLSGSAIGTAQKWPCDIPIRSRNNINRSAEARSVLRPNSDSPNIYSPYNPEGQIKILIEDVSHPI